MLGICGSLMATRLLQGFLFGTEPWDILTFVCVTALVLLLALAATAVPSWPATRVDPVSALRHE